MKKPSKAITVTTVIAVVGIIVYYMSHFSVSGIAMRRNLSRRLRAWKNAEE